MEMMGNIATAIIIILIPIIVIGQVRLTRIREKLAEQKGRIAALDEMIERIKKAEKTGVKP